MKRISYYTAYDDPQNIIGYVNAEDAGDYYIISERSYKNALKRRTVGGDANVIFKADKPVIVRGKDGFIG